jgi:hypothetical protein
MTGEEQHGGRRLRAPEVLRDPPTKRQLAVALGYVLASAIYVTIGVFYTDFLLSVFVGIAYLLLMAWLVPAGVRRLF